MDTIMVTGATGNVGRQVVRGVVAPARLAQITGDATRDLPPTAQEMLRRILAGSPELLALLEGEGASDLESMARVFGEELPSGLILQ